MRDSYVEPVKLTPKIVKSPVQSFCTVSEIKQCFALTQSPLADNLDRTFVQIQPLSHRKHVRLHYNEQSVNGV